MIETIQIQQSSLEGRYAIANQTFQPGNIIFLESPLVSVPKHLDSNHCLWCSIPLNDDRNPELSCSKCKLSYCSQSCQQTGHLVHQSLECGRLSTLQQLVDRNEHCTLPILLLACRLVVLLTLSRPSPTPLPQSEATLPSELILRVQNSFLTGDQAGLKSFLDLLSHEAMIDHLTKESLRDVSRLVLRLLSPALRPRITQPEILQIILILNINSHSIDAYRSSTSSSSSVEHIDASTSSSSSSVEHIDASTSSTSSTPSSTSIQQRPTGVNLGVGLFPTLSLLNHSCDPNCAMSFSPQGHVVLRANRPIPKGHPLHVSYIDLYLPTLHRRLKLLRSKLFLCVCARCLRDDPEDRLIGAQRCTKCPDGLILPPALLWSASDPPLSVAAQQELALAISADPEHRGKLLSESPLRASRCSACENRLSWGEIKKAESACRNLLRSALQQPPAQRYESLSNLLHRGSTLFSRLHGRHYLRTLLLVQMMASAIARVDLSHQHIAIGHIEEVLANVDAVLPPFNLERGAFLEQHGDVCHHIAAVDPSNRGAFIRLVGQALIFYDRSMEQFKVVLGEDHPNTKIVQEKAIYLRTFIHQ